MKQLAVIKDVNFGVGDRGHVCMWFTAHVSECGAALQVLSVEEAVRAIEEAGVSDVHHLNGKTCWVEVGNGLIRYMGMSKI